MILQFSFTCFKPAHFLLFGLILLSGQCFSQSRKSKTIFEDQFGEKLNMNHWKTEIAAPVLVATENGKLVIDSPGGVTVWLDKKLKGDFVIAYDWKVIVAGGKNDRLSDLNQFWMATDPKNTSLFTRTGKFEEYDSLSLYYVGMGGNTNTTTRFRKYDGKGERKLLQEYTDQEHLLKPNHTYRIRIVVQNGETSFWVDGEKYFDYKDPAPLTEGYFGFRSTWSRHQIDNFRIDSL
ncbi:methyltransferase [Dyadobacter luteus]|uniref:Methyltransferase n=1 Tax=Dyadobacter luteus TaxID=2259619 RepID=A0A3D8Y7J6_9BACT|nr:DUF6250 domain-containing protein [Dyadobacter luteus]REA59010.1 methyltransferase [Dyadobacter luteus]